MPPLWPVQQGGPPPVIEGAAHAMNLGHPGDLAHAIGAWLDRREVTDDPNEPGVAEFCRSGAERSDRPVQSGVGRPVRTRARMAVTVSATTTLSRLTPRLVAWTTSWHQHPPTP